MIFEQHFDNESSTYSYLIGSKPGGLAALIDPVQGHEYLYLDRLKEHNLKLAFALDTHTHADHVTAIGELRDRTGCITVMSEYSKTDCVSRRVKNREIIEFDGVKITAIYTPVHTNESLSYLMDDRVFTGDTLLIGGTGRTDFQNGNSYAQYDSLFKKLLALPDETLVYPGHDYNGNKASTIGQERSNNPRLQVNNAEEYARIMNTLKLPTPKLMDIAVPLNLSCGKKAS
ncbi:MAG: hypothetical protein COC05_02175 [Gammaproteobacteria bacterium]|nr:MBL fold metallo-hydrolase [bacterium AH-315-E07]PCH61141.1 MAG: hypothetical protein COC05_02175 [Gammaproteobacteria bacterium]